MWLYVDTVAGIIKENTLRMSLLNYYGVRPLIGTAALLLIPFLAMQFQVPVYDPGQGVDGVNWSLGDFVIMGILLFVTGLAIEVVLRNVGRHKALIALAIALVFIVVWVHLAVGIVDSWPLAGS